ncbi:DUF4160 domain-containing protein [Sphingobium sp. CCH11-B1]|uniref:DUF4160 domain-containing protein n=1 Tax=Sphingobium sp. CCH11-B1 TaxID=1768781 RepID=UPI0008339392|nr:DUF4160 domain-containing protein [Sphingobium sp. CCH11-B1]MEA3388172.1 DUF4160 domain-containing protein [Pseudomonadota bacterium]
MPTVLREGNLRIVIYTDDHPPPHVHVFGDGETKISLSGPQDRVEVVRIVGADRRESRRALEIVREKRDYLLEKWNGIHG